MRKLFLMFTFLFLFSLVQTSCKSLENSHTYRMNFGKLAAGDTIWLYHKTFKGYAVLKDTTVNFGGSFRADSSALKKLKIVGTLISF